MDDCAIPMRMVTCVSSGPPGTRYWYGVIIIGC